MKRPLRGRGAYPCTLPLEPPLHSLRLHHCSTIAGKKIRTLLRYEDGESSENVA